MLEAVLVHRPALANLLAHAAVRRFDGERVMLGFKAHSLLFGIASEASARAHLLQALTLHFGRAPELIFETLVGDVPAPPPTPRREPRGPRS